MLPSYVRLIFIIGLFFQKCSSISILQFIENDSDFSKFYDLVRNNRVAKMLLHNEHITAFIPKNKAFEAYTSELYSNLAYYHIVYGTKRLEVLRRLRSLTAMGDATPQLWINRSGKNIFINNAKIIDEQSDRLFRTLRTQQILHIIDEVLDPKLKDANTSSQTALDFITNPSLWRLENSHKTDIFFYKTKETDTKQWFSQEGGNTYYVPIDSGINPKHFKLVNKYVVGAHMVPNYVLFTRPTMKDLTHESMANDVTVFTVISMEETNGKYFVKAKTVVGNDDNKLGEYSAEILLPNIPVKNGVVHLISNPLGVPVRKLFPYLPIIHKLQTDPTLSNFYEMGERTGFNKIFDATNVSFTCFVPRDTVFWKLNQTNLTFAETTLGMLKNHIVSSDTPYTMDRLVSLSSNNGAVDLDFLSGKSRIKVSQIHDEYVIQWGKNYIKVTRPDYECENGVVHIIEGIMANVHKERKSVEIDENADYFKIFGESVSKMFDDIV